MNLCLRDRIRVPALQAGLAGAVALAIAWILAPSAAGAVSMTPALRPAAASPTTSGEAAAPPLRFEPNVGQSDPRVEALAQGDGYWVFLTSRAAVLALRNPDQPLETPGPGPLRIDTTVLRMEWVGADAKARIVGQEELAGGTNYLLGASPRQWHTGTPAYARARYRGVYRGVDLDFYARQGRLEYDFRVAPGGDPAAIRLRFSGASGMELDGAGNLVLHTAGGDVVQRAPEVYQETGGGRETVQGRYVLLGNHQVGFEVDGYDRGRTLVIDPVMVFSSFLGGTGFDTAYGVAVDGAGSVYLTGWDGSIDFPKTAGSFQATATGGYVTKLDGAHRVVYSAVIPTIGYDVAVDSRGDAWIASDFNGQAGAIHELDATGSSLLFSRNLSGGGATALAVDLADNVYVVGSPPTDFTPTADAFQTTRGSVSPLAFVMKLDPSGAMVYGSYLGNGADSARAVAVDGNGVAYVAGYTFSTSFPTRNAFQSREAGSYDGFVTAVDAQGRSLVYSTYLGGVGGDFVEGIDVDSAGSAYVTGRTLSSDFPLANPFQSLLKGGEDAFVTKLSPDGRTLAYSTFLGGGTTTSGADEAYAVAVDGGGRAVVTGRTDSPNFPMASALEPLSDGSKDVFVAKLDASGTALVYSTYLGGSLSDEGWAVAADGNGGTYVAGATRSYDFPTARPVQRTNPKIGESDGFLAVISETAPGGPLADVTVSLVDSADPVAGGAPLDYTVTYANQGPDPADGVSSVIRLDPFSTFVSLSASQGSCSGPSGTNQIACNLGSLASGASATVTVTIDAPAVDSGSFRSDAFVTADPFDPGMRSDAAAQVTTIGTQASTFTLTVSVTGSGTVTSSNVTGISCPGDCTQSYPDGQGVILQATPVSGWSFDHWGGDCSGTAGCSVTMTANHSVSAVFVQSSTPPPPSGDTVTITRAEYDSRKGQLNVEATSTDSSATLQVFVTSTDALIGTLSSGGNGRYRGRFAWPTNPQSITVRSSSGGSDSTTVTLK